MGDIEDWDNWNLPKIDMVIGGSPCQGFSFAGKGLNFEDPRSKLFFTYAEIVKKLNPIYFLLENVKMKKESLDVITEFLSVEPIMINSSLVCAQNRSRWYWTNINDVSIPKDKNIFWKDVQEKSAKNVFYYTEGSFKWIYKSPKRTEKFKIYNNSTSEKMQMLEASHYKGYSNQRCFGIEDVDGIRYISTIECERLQTLPDNYTDGVSNTQRYKMLGNGWTVDVIAHIFSHLPNKYKIQ